LNNILANIEVLEFKRFSGPSGLRNKILVKVVGQVKFSNLHEIEGKSGKITTKSGKIETFKLVSIDTESEYSTVFAILIREICSLEH